VIYDNTDAAIRYSANWSKVTNTSAYLQTFNGTSTKGAAITLTFTGQTFSILYTAGPKYGRVDVYVDGAPAGTFSQQALKTLYQQRWNYPGQLASGTHTLKLVFNSAKKAQGSFDAVIVTQLGQ
jgi:hypothetical protein